MAEDLHHRPKSPKDIRSIAEPKEYIHLNWVLQPRAPLCNVIEAMAVSLSSDKLFILLHNADVGNQQVIVFDQERKYVTSFGTEGSEEGELNRPCGIAAVDGLVYVTNTRENRIEVFTEDGAFRQRFGSGQLSYPMSIYINNQLLYIIDFNNHRVAVYTLQGDHVCCIGTGKRGTGPGQFRGICDIAFSPDGCMYVLDTGGHMISQQRIQVFAKNGEYKMDLELPYLKVSCCLNMLVTNDRDLLLADGINKNCVAVFCTRENEAKPKSVNYISTRSPRCFAIDKKGNILSLGYYGIAVL